MCSNQRKVNPEKAIEATDRHRSEGVAKETEVTGLEKACFLRNLCQSVASFFS
jgi:hypothetical protein